MTKQAMKEFTVHQFNWRGWLHDYPPGKTPTSQPHGDLRFKLKDDAAFLVHGEKLFKCLIEGWGFYPCGPYFSKNRPNRGHTQEAIIALRRRAEVIRFLKEGKPKDWQKMLARMTRPGPTQCGADAHGCAGGACCGKHI